MYVTMRKNRANEKEVILKPVMSVGDLFGSLPDLDIDRLKKEHIQEVKNEAGENDDKLNKKLMNSML